jgi:hypothetical protein
MTAAGTSLNPELQNPASMKAELLRLEDFVKRARKAVEDGQTKVNNVDLENVDWANVNKGE